MRKLVLGQTQDYLVQVSVCSLNSFFTLNPFSINITAAHRQKVESVLNNSNGSEFILFPEYTYNEALQNLYQDYSNANNCIIIGGSGLEEVGANYYAYSPIFFPNREPINVYKKNITTTETVLSGGRIIGYPNEVQREFSISVNEDTSYTFSVFVCYDFLIDPKSRTNIIFVPQNEPSPQQFINEADRISKGHESFVLGSNNSNDNHRSLGFAILNSQLITALAERGWRQLTYNDGNGNLREFHHTTFYDIQGERLLKFRINIGRPYSLPFTFNFGDHQPVLIPLSDIAI